MTATTNAAIKAFVKQLVTERDSTTTVIDALNGLLESRNGHDHLVLDMPSPARKARHHVKRGIMSKEERIAQLRQVLLDANGPLKSKAIGKKMGLKSTSGMARILIAGIEAGVIKREANGRSAKYGLA